jgi:hypothetical protein
VKKNSLSHALLARCLLNDGCPGGTDCEDAEGLYAVSIRLQCDRARDTYDAGPPLLGCAASGCGMAGAAFAMKECSPDIILLARSACVCTGVCVEEGDLVTIESVWHALWLGLAGFGARATTTAYLKRVPGKQPFTLDSSTSCLQSRWALVIT